jgi:uncharacterized protein YcfJ
MHHKPVFRLLLVVIASVALMSCASRRAARGEPIVDMKGVDPVAYNTDLGECKEYADQVNVGGDVATGAATGAVVGGAIGAIFGNSNTAARGAGAGAVTGGVSGAGRGLNERNQVVRNCLRGRGYRVLN